MKLHKREIKLVISALHWAELYELSFADALTGQNGDQRPSAYLKAIKEAKKYNMLRKKLITRDAAIRAEKEDEK